MYNFYGICVLCKSLVLCGVMPRLYTQVSKAEVTMSNSDTLCFSTPQSNIKFAIKSQNAKKIWDKSVQFLYI